MEEVWSFIQTLLNPKSIIEYGGFALLVFVIFAETGLFFGFFLPGDSLLFMAGLFCATGLLDVSIYVLTITLIIAAIAGNFVGFWFGKRTGPLLLKRKDSLLFKKKYVETARDFYQKYGGLALIISRFLPIFRTFVPIFAGIVLVDFRRFTFYNITGAILWVGSLVLSGYFLGRKFPQIEEYLLYIVIGIIVLSTIPVISTFVRKKVEVIIPPPKNKQPNE